MGKRFFNALSWMKAIIFALMGVILIRTFVLTPVLVSGKSMYPTLNDGDMVILWELGNRLELFDVVVFENVEEEYFIKRLIGLPGQTISYEQGQLFIDGYFIDEPFLPQGPLWENTAGTRDFTHQDICVLNALAACSHIPEGYYLVLGDNRRISEDSRHLGLIHESQILGTVSWIQWPMDRMGIIR